MSEKHIYLDYASSTPLLTEVKAAVAAVLDEGGNPSSLHAGGRAASQAVEHARKQVAALINPSTRPDRLARDSAPRDVLAGLHAKPEEIYFTSCGTESNNWAIRGLLAANKRKAPPDLLRTAKQIEAGGAPARLSATPSVTGRAGGSRQKAEGRKRIQN